MRVIAGTLKGHTLNAPAGMRTRPTSGRVREALFSILGDVSGTTVLDLYAGSGALGIEALSRGASSAVFVESSKSALACLEGNLSTLGLSSRATVLRVRAERAAAALAALPPFDLIFCDPPWAESPRALALLVRLAEAGVFADGARILVEHAARDALELSNDGPLCCSGTRRWGDTAISTLLPLKKPQLS